MMKVRILIYIINALVSGNAFAEITTQDKVPPVIKSPAPALTHSKLLEKPDESILWRLFHAGKYDEVTRQIRYLQKQYPSWQAPADLTRALAGIAKRKSVVRPSTTKTATPKRAHPAVRAAVKKDPCAGMDRKWQRAEGLQNSNLSQKALKQYETILNSCSDQILMVTTLEKASIVLDYPVFAELLVTGQRYLPAEVLDKYRYQAQKNLFFKNNPQTLPELNNQAALIQPGIDTYSDDLLAAIIGWRYFDLEQYRLAKDWLKRAVTWNQTNDNAWLGYLLSMESLQEYDQVLDAVAKLETSDPQILALAGRVHKLKAWQALENKQYRLAENHIVQAEKYSGADAELSELKAWQASKQGQYNLSARQFFNLYREKEEQRYAKAYIENQIKADRDGLAPEVFDPKSVLFNEYQKIHGQELYDRKQFLSAHKLAPSDFPKLSNIDSPYVDMGGYIRYKSGNEGTSRLDLFKTPAVTGSYTANGEHNFKFNVNRVELFSGRVTGCKDSLGGFSGEFLQGEADSLTSIVNAVPDNLEGEKVRKDLQKRIVDWPIYPLVKDLANSIISSIPDNRAAGLVKQDFSQGRNDVFNTCAELGNRLLPVQRLQNSVEFDFVYRKDGWFSPFIKMGSTPIGGVIDPMFTFDVGFDQQASFGNWSVQAYSQPVRQSILSYTGVKDPYYNLLVNNLDLFDLNAVKDANIPYLNYLARLTESGVKELKWGRVLRTGGRASAFYRFNEHWSLSGAADLAWLHGENVEDNLAVEISLDLGRNIEFDGFDYFKVGPSINYQHFDKNLSHFTFGHGGYFSPEHYYNIGAGISFLTREGESFVIKGRFNAGFQGIKEASVPWFPLEKEAIGNYLAAHDSSEALDFELKGVWLVAPNIQLGGGAAMRKTDGFEDYTGGLFVRYFFENRKASFSSDIPQGMFSSMY